MATCYFLTPGFLSGKNMTPKKNSRLSRLFQIAGAKKLHLIISAILAVISSACSLAPYIIIYLVMLKVLDPGFGAGDYSYILNMAFIAAGIVVSRYLLMFASAMFSHIAAFKILYGLRTTLTEHLGKLPMGYFTTNQTGKTKKILFEDVEEIEKFIAHHIPDIVSGITLPSLIVIFLFTVDWRMALVALLPLPLALYTQQKAFDKDGRKERRKKYHNALETMNATIVEYVKGMPVVKIFNQTVESFTCLKESTDTYRHFIKQITLDQAPPWAAFIVITSSGLFFILPFGLWFYLNGAISLPTLLLFIMLGSGYMTPLFKLAMLGGQLGHILEGITRIDNILSLPIIAEPETGRHPQNSIITFKNVSFRYGDQMALNNVSFSIDEGKVTALVGPSGSGKSTIVQLLLRMWDISEGKIMLGGVDIREISYSELMNRIGFVSQEGYIFSDTVYENIRMGMENVSMEDIERAAHAAQCDGFIRKLPKGFHTRIGEGGEVHLSGGEKQRISLARIILKNAPIVVLDEATAYADAENESRIQAAFAEIMRNKTVIVIAHRLSTITDADTILVIKDGAVAEEGRHEKLIAVKGVYHAMWKAHTAAQDWALSLGGAN
jgi:ATP-binding cassette subfamily B protein IrtA